MSSVIADALTEEVVVLPCAGGHPGRSGAPVLHRTAALLQRLAAVAPAAAGDARPGIRPDVAIGPAQVCGSAAADVVPAPHAHAPAGDGPDRPQADDGAALPHLPVAQIVAQTVAQMMDDKTMRAHLQEMIREELEGEMGARFSGNLRAVVRREIATALDERLTHL